MRVLVYGLVGTNRGGIETFLLNMNEHMSVDCVFDYVVEEEECIHETRINAKGGRVLHIPSRRKSPFKNILSSWKMMRAAKRDNTPVYFNLSSLSWIFPIIVARMNELRVFVHSHNAEFIDVNSGLVYRIVNACNKWFLKRLKITRLSCSEPASLFMFGETSDVTMIYNAIDINKFKYNESIRSAVRQDLGMNESLVIGFVGRLVFQKNPEFLVDLAKYLSKSMTTSWRVVMLGEGNLKQSLMSLIEKNNLSDMVKLLGNVPNPNDYMQGFDLFCLPSRHEGLPYVLVEAQAAGLPCIVSDVITQEVDATGLVSFLSIDDNLENWYKAIIDSKSFNRHSYHDIIKATRFNIEIEAPNLERILSE